MNREIKENFQEKLRLVNLELLHSLDKKIKQMLAEHSRDGLLASGATIKRTMDFIAEENANLYSMVLDHLSILRPGFYPELESDIQSLAKVAQESYKKESFLRLEQSTKTARNHKLFERMLPEVEAGMASDLAKFQNSLNAVALDIKHNSTVKPSVKFLLGVEFLLLLLSAFIAGLWYNDPNGNYEPILAGLGLVIPTIGVILAYHHKK